VCQAPVKKKAIKLKKEERADWTATLVLLHGQGDTFIPEGQRTPKKAPNSRNSTFLAHLGKQGFPNSS